MTFLTLLFTAMGTNLLRAEDGNVAKVGDTEYAKLADAVNAAQADDEIKVIADIATNLDLTISKKVTLDLGGFTLSDAYIKIAAEVTVKNGDIKNTTEPYPLVVNSGKLTVEDVDIEASKSDRAIWVREGGELVFNSGSSILATKGTNNTYSKIYGVWVSQGATANIYGGTITVDAGADATAVAIFGNYENNTVNIYGGKISTSGKTYSYAVWADGDVTITGGEIVTNEKQYGYSSGITYGKNYAIYSKGDVEISGDTKITTYGPSGYIVNTYGSNQKVNIAGGEFTNVLSEVDKTAGGHSAPNLIYGSSVDATIAGGDFNGYKGEELIKGTGSTLTITGGSFDNKPKDDYVAVGATITVGETTYTKTEDGLEEVIPVASVNGTSYATLDDALSAASAMTGDVTVEIYERVTLGQSLSGSYSSIKFVGKDTDAEIYLDVQGYITATGKNVAFEDLTLSKSEGGFINNAGFMNVAFGVYDVTEVTYTNCVFDNGAYASSGNVTYTGCTFKRSHDKYGLWAYGNVDVTVDDCIFADYRGIKMYAEGAAKTVDLTVKNTNFSAVTDKPAIVLTYGEKVTLEGNTYSETGTFELDLDGDPNGTTVTSDVDPICKNDNGACGVLCDGKIYTTVAQAAEVATSGSTVTLLHNSTETVVLPAGVILDKNGYAAAGITVTQPVAKIGETTYYTLAEAAAEATEGETITMLADAAEDVTIPAGVSFNGNGKAVGNIIAAGTITFNGHTKATSFNVENTNTTVNIVEGACLEITGTGRMVIGHGCTFNITGSIADDAAKTANVADLTPSLIMPGASFTGAGVTFNVTNAYIKAPSSYCSSSKSASGTFVFKFDNSIWESAGKLAFESQSTAATVNFELKDSKLTTGSHLVFGVSRGEVVFDNSNVNVGTSRQIENQSTMTVKNGSVVNGAVATSSNAKNPGTLIVDNATYAVTGEFSGSDLGTGTLIIKKGANVSVGSIEAGANVVVDAEGMAAGYDINFTADLSKFTGTLSVINNDKLEAKIVDGKIVLVEKPVAKIGDVEYTTLEDAFKAATSGCTIEILENVTVDYAWDNRYTGSKFTVPVTINGNDKTIKFTASVNDNNYQAPFRFQAHAAVNNLIIDMSEVTDNRFRAISSNANLTVNGCKFIGKDKTLNCRAIIFGEGAGTNVGNLEISITDCNFVNWRRGITDNENGDDVKNVTITGNTLTNSAVYVSAYNNVTFTGNTVTDAYVNIKSYTADNKLKVTATGNELTENTGTTYNSIDAGGVVVAQEGFVVAPKGDKPIAYVSETTIWGQTWANAKESYVIKVLNEENEVMGTSALNTSLDVTMDGDVEVTWHITLPGITDEDQYWIQEWTTDPSIYNMPAKVALWVDGVEVNEGPVKLNGPDDTDMIYAAVTDEAGKIYSYHTSIADAITAIENNNTRSVTPNVIALLRNTDETVTLPAGITLNLNGHEAPNVSVPVAQIGETPYYTLAEAVAAAQNGATITLLNGEHELPLFAGKELTFKGESKEGVIVNDAPDATIQGWNGSTFHFENLTAKGATANYHGLANGVVAVTYKNCNINGLRFLYSPTTFEDCAFNANGVEHSFWTYGASNVTVTGCTFTYTDRAVNCYSENGANHELHITFTGCTFTYANTNATSEGAVEINSSSVKSINLVMNGCTAPANGAMWFISQWDLKHGANTVVKVDGVVVWTAPAKIGETKYATLQEALDAAAAGTGNVTVEILEDIDLTGIDWNPVTVSAPGYPVVTVEGNDKTITGLNDMLFAGTWAGGSGLIINNLTIANSTIVNDENDANGNIGVGAFIGFPQASATITLNNCDLVNSTVEGGHWTGGLIGYAAGYAGTDGPVFMELTITGCSVTGSTITGKGSAGGIIGHGSGNAWTDVVIENTTVSNNIITSTGTSTNKAGAIMGTIGAAGQPTTVNDVTHTGGAMVAATVSGNTVTSGGTAITTIYGRQGTDTGILELNGGTYDNYPIEQNVAYAKPAPGLMIEQNEYGTYGLVPDPAYGKVAMIGETYYETLSAAFAAVTNDEQTVVILSDVTEKLEGAYLRGNITTKDGTKVTITLTNQDCVPCPYTFILGENITLNVPALFYYAGGAQINGTVVAGAYYQRYANSKLTINEPGSMKVTTETFIVRYMDADPNAGIYIIGDNNDETIGLDASVIYFYQGMINAKDADIKVGTYWQTNETDNNEGSANLVLDNSNMTVTVNEHNMKATANSTVTLTNGSNVTVAGGYQGVGVSIDATSSMTMARSIFVSKINNYHYTSLQEAATAAQDGETIELLWQEGQASIAMNASLYGNKNVTITGNATVDWSKGFLFVGRGGEGNATLTFDNANLTSASDNASTGIHVSGREKDTNDKYDGTLVINNSTIELDYLINKGTMTLDESTLTVKNGFSVGGRPASETESGQDATATITLNNGSKVVVNNHNGMGLGYEAIGVMDINSGSTFETTQSFLITAKGTMNVNGGNVKTVGTLTNNGAVNVTGESILDIETLTENEIDFLDGAIIKNSTVGGGVFVAGKVTFGGNNTFAMLYDYGTLTGYYGTTANMEWTVEEGASLTLTDKARYGLGYGDNVTINGSITDALEARENLTEDDRSLFMHGLVAQESSGWNCNSKLTVKNAYVVLGSNNSFGNKPGNYGGNYTFNFNNSVVDGSRITFYEALSTTEFTFEDSDVKIGTFMTRDTDSKFTLKNSKVLSTATSNGTDEGNYNAGELTLDKSSLTYSAEFANTGTLNIGESSTFTAPSVVNNGAINFTALSAKLDTDTEGLTIVDQVNNPDYKVVYKEGAYQFVEKVYVAQIGENKYESLQEAVEAAQNDEIITLLVDVEQADGVIIDSKNIVVDLNGKTFTVTEGANTSNRNFKIKGTSVVTIKNGTMVAAGDYDSGAYGTVRTEGAANVTLTGLKLYNYRGNGLNIKALAGTEVEIDNTEIYSEYGGGIEAAGGTITLAETVKVEQKGMYTAPYNSMAISVNGGGLVTVNGGTYSTECITAEEANNQGTSHGPWVVGVLNSGGTLIINGGTFSNDNYGDNSLATYARGAVLADTGAEIEINGGTFNALKAIIDIQNNLGDQNNNPSALLSGGTFSADPKISASYGSNLIVVAEGYRVTQLPNGYFTVVQVSGTQTFNMEDAGWYWFSTYIKFDTEGEGLDALKYALADDASLIKGQYAFTNYLNYNNTSFWTSGNNALTTLSPSQMYMINTTSDNVEVDLTGAFLDYEADPVTINVVEGWNWIGYPVSEEVNINNAIPNAKQGDVIKSQFDGHAMYYKDYPFNNTTLTGWYGELTTLKPGRGYMYQASEGGQFSYTKGNGNGAKSNIIDYNGKNYWFADATQYPNNMSIVAMLSIDGEIVKGNYEVAAFANGECRGSARPIYIEAIDTYVLYMTIYGDEVEELTFMYYDIDKDTEYELSNVMNYSNDAIVGTLSDPYIFSMNILGIGENSIDNINIYPNPTTTDREINLQATCDKVEVFNALGVKVAEYHNVDTLDALETAGIYVIRITNDNAVKHCRLVVK